MFFSYFCTSIVTSRPNETSAVFHYIGMLDAKNKMNENHSDKKKTEDGTWPVDSMRYLY